MLRRGNNIPVILVLLYSRALIFFSKLIVLACLRWRFQVLFSFGQSLSLSQLSLPVFVFVNPKNYTSYNINLSVNEVGKSS